MYVALHGMYSDGNLFRIQKEMKKNFNPKFCLFEPVKRNAKEKKKRGKENRKKKKREEKRREIITGRFSASDEGE